jgi:predicted nucleic acid-binding protein
MKKEVLYLDTSVVSAYYDRRAKERQETTTKFWKEVLPKFHACISEIIIEELENTREKILRSNFMKLVKSFKVLKINKKIQALAKIYIEKGIFPARYIDDARHVAIVSYYEIPYLVSWNFEHLVKVKTRRLVNSINILEGFREIEIISPQEL